MLDPDGGYFLRTSGGETGNDGAELELGDPRADTSEFSKIGLTVLQSGVWRVYVYG